MTSALGNKMTTIATSTSNVSIATQLTITEKDRRRLKKIKINLMRTPRFALWSGIMMVGSTSIDIDMPTACTNGRDEIYGLLFMRGMDDKELGFIVLHENLHKAFRHMTTWTKLYKLDPQLANAACDFVINLIIVKTDPDEQYVAMPRKDGKIYGCLDHKYEGMNSKQVFDLLRQEKQEGGDGEVCDGEGGSGELSEGFDEHDWEGAAKMEEEEIKELEREVDRALRQGQIAANKVAGSEKGYGSRLITELLEPKINWQEVLQQYVVTHCRARDASSWRRPNRRYLAMDIYMPTLIGETMRSILFAIDMSGSISQEEGMVFLSEGVGACKAVNPELIRILYWGSSVVGDEEYGQADIDNILQLTKPMNGGGTSPSCVSEYIKDKKYEPECIVILTDGYVGSDWGSDWNAPVLWVVKDNPSATASTGKTLHIDGEDLSNG